MFPSHIYYKPLYAIMVPLIFNWCLFWSLARNWNYTIYIYKIEISTLLFVNQTLQKYINCNKLQIAYMMWTNIFVGTCKGLLFSPGHVEYSNKSVTGTDSFPFSYYPVGTVASFSCSNYRDISENITRTCQSSGIWDQESPECIPSKHITLQYLLYSFYFHEIIWPSS